MSTEHSSGQDDGNTQAVTLHGNRILVFTNGRKGEKYMPVIRQNAPGSRTVAWPVAVRWPGHTAPTLTTTAARTDYISFFYNGVNYDALGLAPNY